jgi:Protein of unknown function (DUF3710)
VFRRRRRDGKDQAGLEPGDADYPAAEDELADQDEAVGWADDQWADGEWADGELADTESGDTESVDTEPADEEGLREEEAPARLAGAGEEAGGAADPAQRAQGRAGRADLGDPETWTRLRDTQAITPAMIRSAGPWDGAGEYPDSERIDFGSLLVPVRDGYDVQVFVSEEEGISIAVVHDDSGLQLQPFAAPRSAGLWHEVMPEIAEEVAKAGGQSSEQDGPFGPELVATVIPQGADVHDVPPQPLRFMGADGPRWFLRGLISGPAATDSQLALPFEEIFADVVVVRGDHAEPPRKPLEIRLPDEARQVLETQLASQDPNLLNPFERGPEITETR